MKIEGHWSRILMNQACLQKRTNDISLKSKSGLLGGSVELDIALKRDPVINDRPSTPEQRDQPRQPTATPKSPRACNTPNQPL